MWLWDATLSILKMPNDALQANSAPAASAKLPSAAGTLPTTHAVLLLTSAAAISRPWPSGRELRAELTAGFTILLQFLYLLLCTGWLNQGETRSLQVNFDRGPLD